MKRDLAVGNRVAVYTADGKRRVGELVHPIPGTPANVVRVAVPKDQVNCTYVDAHVRQVRRLAKPVRREIWVELDECGHVFGSSTNPFPGAVLFVEARRKS